MAKFIHPEMVLAISNQKIEDIIAVFWNFSQFQPDFGFILMLKLPKTGQLDQKLTILAKPKE